MMLLVFACIDPKGTYQECTYGGPDIESCLDALTYLVKAGWQLKRVDMVDGDRRTVTLPVDAFDDMLMGDHLKSLQYEWEQTLCQEHRDK